MREQVKFVFQIGMEVPHYQFMNDVARAASELCGGCTTSLKTGFWMDDEDRRQAFFMGNLEEETCFELELTCEMEKAEAVYHSMKHSIAALAQVWEVQTDWVHVSEIPMRGRHFSVASLNAPIAAE